MYILEQAEYERHEYNRVTSLAVADTVEALKEYASTLDLYQRLIYSQQWEYTEDKDLHTLCLEEELAVWSTISYIGFTIKHIKDLTCTK